MGELSWLFFSVLLRLMHNNHKFLISSKMFRKNDVVIHDLDFFQNKLRVGLGLILVKSNVLYIYVKLDSNYPLSLSVTFMNWSKTVHLWCIKTFEQAVTYKIWKSLCGFFEDFSKLQLIIVFIWDSGDINIHHPWSLEVC